VSETLLETITGELGAILATLILMAVTALLDRLRGRPAIIQLRPHRDGDQPGYTAHEKAGDPPQGTTGSEPGYR